MTLAASRSPSHLGWSSPSPCTPSRASPTRFGWSSPSPTSGLDDSALRNVYLTSLDSRASTPAHGSRPASRGTGFGSLPQTPTSNGAKRIDDRAYSPGLDSEDSRPGSAPLTHAQRVAELHYDQFCTRRMHNRRNQNSKSAPAPTRRRKKAPDVSCAWAQLPSSWRPAAFEVEVEMRQTGFEFNEALASLVVGRDTATTLATVAKNDRLAASRQSKQSGRTTSMTPIGSLSRERGYTSPIPGYSSPMHETVDSDRLLLGAMPLNVGVLNVKACLDELATGAFALDRPQPSRVVAAAALLQGSDGIANVSTVQMEDMELEEAPDTLHIISSLSTLSLSDNSPLHNIGALKKCNGIRMLDLSGCPRLRDIQVLGLLPFLEVVDLARCSGIEDITPLLIPSQRETIVGAVNVEPVADLSPATSPVKGIRQLRARRKEQERALSQGRKKKLGHPSLRWLSMSGCTSLKSGILHFTSCEALVYLDLYECLQVDSSECFSASQVLGLRDAFVWPSRSTLQKAVLEQSLSQHQQKALTAAAATAIAEKLAVARGRRPVLAGTTGLPSLTGQAKRETMNAAISAASDMGIFTSADDAKWDTEVQVEGLQADSDTEGVRNALEEVGMRSHRRKVGFAQPRIGPVDFARAARAVGFQDPNGVDICDIFKILDENNDGGLTVEELCALEVGPPVEAETDAAIDAFLARKGGNVEAAAADLAGNRETIDKCRLQECLTVAGIRETIAVRIAHALAHCCGSMYQGDDTAENVLLNALNGFVVAHSAVLLKDFRDHLRSRFPRCEDAFWVLSEYRQSTVGWDEYRRRMLNPIRWPAANKPGALESLFRALDMDGLGCITANVFQLLEDFEPSQTLKAMAHAGRCISCGLAGGAPAAFRLGEALDDKAFTRSEFSTSWDEFGDVCQDVDARLVFGLLDIHGNNFLTGRELFTLSEALVRRAEAASLGALEVLLTKQFGSLREMHNLLLRRDAYATLPITSMERSPSKTRISVATSRASVGVSRPSVASVRDPSMSISVSHG